jgi:hypothetical protein
VGVRILHKTLVILAGSLLAVQANSAMAGSNLIVNGNFGAGNTGFTSQYTYSPGDLYPANTYDVASNPNADNANWPNIGAAPGNGSSNMLIVNGGLVGDNIVWSETISVTPNTNYDFSTYLVNLYTTSPATLEFSANGAALGTTFTAGPAVGTWDQFFATFNSGANTSVVLSLVDTNTAYGGNDFAMDSVCFASGTTCQAGSPVGGTGTTTVPEPSTWALMLAGFAGLGFLGLKRARRDSRAI